MEGIKIVEYIPLNLFLIQCASKLLVQMFRVIIHLKTNNFLIWIHSSNPLITSKMHGISLQADTVHNFTNNENILAKYFTGWFYFAWNIMTSWEVLEEHFNLICDTLGYHQLHSKLCSVLFTIVSTRIVIISSISRNIITFHKKQS